MDMGVIIPEKSRIIGESLLLAVQQVFFQTIWQTSPLCIFFYCNYLGVIVIQELASRRSHISLKLGFFSI